MPETREGCCARTLPAAHPPGSATGRDRRRRLADYRERRGASAGSGAMFCFGKRASGVLSPRGRAPQRAPWWQGHRTVNPTAKAAVDQIATAGLGNGTTGITVGISDPSLGYYVKSYGTSDGTPVTPKVASQECCK
jgi:hypothetical protein